MIAQLKSKKEVLLDTFNNVSGKPQVEITHMVRENDEYRVNGSYFYEVPTLDAEGNPALGQDGKPILARKPIANVSTVFSHIEVKELCKAIGVADVDLLLSKAISGGLRHIVGKEGKWGLKNEDWE